MVTVEFKGKKYNFKDSVELVDILISQALAAKELNKDNVEMESQIYLIAQLNLDNPKLTFKELNSNPAFGLKCFGALKTVLEGLQAGFL